MTDLSTPPVRRAPAEPEFWIFVFGDLSVFTAFFVVWAVAARQHAAAFAAGHATLNQAIGVTNTALLLCSSAAVAVAVRAIRAGELRLARSAYLTAIVLGAGFLALKAVEYAQHLTHGLNAMAGPFFVDYFVFTGIHALHVLLGLACLAVARTKLRTAPEPPRLLMHEAVATYWHMIDIVWIVLFSLIYLNGGGAR